MTLGIGILGFAHGHVSTYCQQWRKADHGLRLVAGWDHDAARAGDACARFELKHAGSVEDMLKVPGVEAVVIGAETSRHADLCEQAAAAGKAIVLQKPLALTMQQADRIVAAAQRVPFSLAWQMRVDAQNVQMKRLIESGAIGRVLMVRRRHGLSTHLWKDFDRSWHVDPALNRGMWADDASHAIDFLLWLLGEPVSVMADIDTLVNAKVPDDHGIAIYRYADGTFAEVVSSFTCPAGENTTEIVGERGVIIQNFGDAPSCNVPRPPGAIGLKWFVHGDSQWQISDIESPPNHGPRIAALAKPLASFLCGECPPIATAQDGRTALRMTLASYESARLGRRVLMKDV
jgi:predicted dehydrogenase